MIWKYENNSSGANPAGANLQFAPRRYGICNSGTFIIPSLNYYLSATQIPAMTDVHEPEVRSYNMSRIKSKDTKPELVVRKFLFKNGFRYRLHVKDLPGKPDIVLPKYKTVIFVNGCFWHGHLGCKHFVLPKTRTEWWQRKISNNQIRDSKHIHDLEILGWKVIRIWTCELKTQRKEETLIRLIREISYI